MNSFIVLKRLSSKFLFRAAKTISHSKGELMKLLNLIALIMITSCASTGTKTYEENFNEKGQLERADLSPYAAEINRL